MPYEDTDHDEDDADILAEIEGDRADLSAADRAEVEHAERVLAWVRKAFNIITGGNLKTDTATTAAIEAFQKGIGLPVTGIADEDTVEALTIALVKHINPEAANCVLNGN